VATGIHKIILEKYCQCDRSHYDKRLIAFVFSVTNLGFFHRVKPQVTSGICYYCFVLYFLSKAFLPVALQVLIGNLV